ncbi:MobC family plasmid mobilization relaxosome protein [Acidicapsa acidisoli]|uniref:MobC family plasmid mobilization relaxosome protein n=1 Tax=Acidicapsa acidisoli TaxID=1615681 RepID=UPI0021E0385B|nr:MobC family plasmid mobilization relaxosome protein [Acidicapsa acidisoli]
MAGSDKRRRPRQSLVRWTDEEFNAVSAKADKAGLAIAAFMRAAALGDPGPRAQRRPPADHKALRQILGQLGRIGNNLNQIARALNAGEQIYLPELKDALRAYIAIRDVIFKALGKKPGPDP